MIPSPRPVTAAARPGRFRALNARPQGFGRSGLVIFLVTHLTWVVVAAVVTAHVLLADDAYPLPARALIAVPAVILLLEGRAYIKGGARELPIGILALVQYYLAFSFPVFFDVPFFDLTGPVTFNGRDPPRREPGGGAGRR